MTGLPMHEIVFKKRFAILASAVLVGALGLSAVPSHAATNPLPNCSQAGGRICTIVFDSPTSTYSWTVPANASGLHVRLVGGAGGNAASDLPH